jgi:hypothetical protein
MSRSAENDRLRTTFKGGTLFISEGVWALGLLAADQILKAVKSFGDFSREDDPRGEHDFGRFEVAGQKLVWKIECELDAAEHGRTGYPGAIKRALLIMLEEEH